MPTPDIPDKATLFQGLMDVIPDLISIHDRDMNILYSNWNGFGNVSMEKRRLGDKCYSVYRGFEDICHGCKAQQVFETGIAYSATRKLADGRWINLRILPYPGKELIVEWVQEITDKMAIEEALRESEEQLKQSQKLDAVGQLAGGVAHDFNNMIGGILGASDLLENCLDDKPEGKEYLEMIRDAGAHASALAGKLLAFSRRQSIGSTPIDVHKTLSEAVSILTRTIDRRIEIVTRFHPENATVIGDPSQLESVFLNLGINASHAMPDGGTITFTTMPVTLSPSYCDRSPFDLIPGTYLKTEVQDTGTGIPENIMNRIFEPFFTTKEQGKGTGLGLSASYGIIKQHKGSITVSSELGRGTSFQILLPLTKEEAMRIDRKPVPLYGKGRILLVDDEDIMRSTGETLLSGYGYDVVTARDGQEAFDLYKKEGPLDLVIMDMIMPRMNGRDCFRKLRNLDPSVRILLSSGFSREEDLAELTEEGLNGFISKPFRGYELSRKVAEILED